MTSEATEESLSRRRERRFKTSDDQALQCLTKVDDRGLIAGAVIDISPSGMRLLCHGTFTVGQTFSTELHTDRAHGVFCGVIRRVEPWTGGKSILGCELLDKVPSEILETLAQEGAVNRRRDDRVEWNQAAKISWELQPEVVEIELRDCSTSGLKVSSSTTIPDNLRLRISLDTDGDGPVVFEAKSVWQLEQGDGVLAGLAFTKREVPEVVRQVLGLCDGDVAVQAEQKRSRIRLAILVAATLLVLGLGLLQSGAWV